VDRLSYVREQLLPTVISVTSIEHATHDDYLQVDKNQDIEDFKGGANFIVAGDGESSTDCICNTSMLT
jgi:hypothetical protein